MRRPRAQARGTEYPIEVELVATDEPVEFVLSNTERHGSNDSGRRGDYPRRVTPGGRAAAFEGLSAEWSSVLPGTEARAAASQWSICESGATDTTVTIRVHPQACPVLIEVDRIWSSYSEDHDEFGATHYAVSAARGKKRAKAARTAGH